MPKRIEGKCHLGTILLAGIALFLILPTTPIAQGARTLSAGVGEEGRKPEPDYSVRFEFAEIGGAYLAGVSVTVKDATGAKLIEVVSAGPWLFADLPPGDYSIVAAAKSGAKQGALFSVEPGGQRVVRLAWR